MNLYSVKISFISIFLLLPNLIWANILNDLTPEERREVLNKKLIVKTSEVKEATWPEVTIYALINSTALEAVAVFAAYHYQKEYVPHVLISQPVKHVTPTDVHVSYERDNPWPLSNSSYTTGNRLKRFQKVGYEVEWYFVKSDSTTESRGKAHFLPYEQNAILRYRTFIQPKSFFARFVKGSMVSDVTSAVQSIVNYIDMLKKEKPQDMKKFIKLVNGALAGRNVFEKIISKSCIK